MHFLLGFTLVELLLTLAVGSILLLVAVPGFSHLLATQQLEDSALIMQRSLSLARGEAITKGKSLTLSRLNGAWRDGWLLYEDSSQNGHYDDGEKVFRVFPALPKAIQLTGNAPVSRYIRFTPDGRATLLNGGYQIGTLTVCRQGGRQAIRLTINNAGRATLKRVMQPCNL
ncbi:type IV fimbrial biogenesis protein FimT [Pseudomonas duriflava]|uniref:Type II secretion system protein H n=1 Tax=Pseudomonas duriflava TaxID=459528 RepID=A0A562QC42_9PSED|nr:GspH/FimT family pseudopilin [Pseudomonas duriflava]TWI54327.1 type IV fimbrial biogenesis protein FimT [Pseudomonas duriflava]